MFLLKVADEGQLETIVELANIIWSEHFIPIIGKAQVDYMLEKFQSEESISEQIQSGVIYFLMMDNSKAIGYAAITLNDSELFINKFYILSDERNKGFGRQTLRFLEEVALGQDLAKISLTVHKNNCNTINAYQKMGFINLGSIVQDIGENYLMDDYKMEKKLNILEQND